MKKYLLLLIIILICTGCISQSSIKRYKSMEKETVSLSINNYSNRQDEYKNVVDIDLPTDITFTSIETRDNNVYNDSGNPKPTVKTIKSLMTDKGYGPTDIDFTLYNNTVNEVLIQISAYRKYVRELENTETINGHELYYGAYDKNVLSGIYNVSDDVHINIIIAYSNNKNSAINEQNIQLLKDIVSTIKPIE